VAVNGGKCSAGVAYQVALVVAVGGGGGVGGLGLGMRRILYGSSDKPYSAGGDK